MIVHSLTTQKTTIFLTEDLKIQSINLVVRNIFIDEFFVHWFHKYTCGLFKSAGSPWLARRWLVTWRPPARAWWCAQISQASHYCKVYCQSTHSMFSAPTSVIKSGLHFSNWPPAAAQARDRCKSQPGPWSPGSPAPGPGVTGVWAGSRDAI